MIPRGINISKCAIPFGRGNGKGGGGEGREVVYTCLYPSSLMITLGLITHLHDLFYDFQDLRKCTSLGHMDFLERFYLFCQVACLPSSLSTNQYLHTKCEVLNTNYLQPYFLLYSSPEY